MQLLKDAINDGINVVIASNEELLKISGLYQDITMPPGTRIVAIFDKDMLKIEELYNTDPTSTDNVVLDVPHVSQTAPGARARRNDCGAACALSVILWKDPTCDLTVDDITKVYQRPNKPMWIDEVRRALSAHRINNSFTKNMSPTSIKEHLRVMEAPVIALVSYPELPNQFVEYMGSHYIVIYGIKDDGSLLYLDPLGDGSELSIGYEHLKSALKMVSKDKNTPNIGISILS